MGFFEVFWMVLQNVTWVIFGLFGFVFAYFAARIMANLFIHYDIIIEEDSLSLWFVYLICSIVLFILSLTFGLSCFVMVANILFLGG